MIGFRLSKSPIAVEHLHSLMAPLYSTPFPSIPIYRYSGPTLLFYLILVILPVLLQMRQLDCKYQNIDNDKHGDC